MACKIAVFIIVLCVTAYAEAVPAPEWDSGACDPSSTFLEAFGPGLTQDFCATWDPDFKYRGSQCCAPVHRRFGGRRVGCSPDREKANFCDEMTDEQRLFLSGRAQDPRFDYLDMLAVELGSRPQSHCGPANGFLSWGRPLVATDRNHLRLRNPHRCTNFGTDRMIGMLEWLGRQMGGNTDWRELTEAEILVGDISAPRGGCLAGYGKGHGSHMNGRDVDLGFVSVDWGNLKKSDHFHRHFEGGANWWLLKKIFSNPFACVELVFVDRQLISILRKAAKEDPEWTRLSRYIRHYRGHRNHFHVRIGDREGPAGCVQSENFWAKNSQ